jgi:hypothetical protein
MEAGAFPYFGYRQVGFTQQLLTNINALFVNDLQKRHAVIR